MSALRVSSSLPAKRSPNSSAKPRQKQQASMASGGNASKTHHLQLVAGSGNGTAAAGDDEGAEEMSIIPQIEQQLQVRPGKRGGRYKLPDGGSLTVPEAGGFSRTDNLTVKSVHPSELAEDWCRFELGELEALVSPVYQLGGTVRTLRCLVSLRLPLRLPDGEPGQFSKLRLLHRGCGGGAVWKEIPPGVVEADNSSVTIDTRSLGTYMMLLSPLEETFQISPNGGLIDFRIEQGVSLRVPKNAFQVPRLFKLRILQFSQQGTELARQLRRSETMDIAGVTPMYSFHCDDDHDHALEDHDSAPIKRGITVKLPMPAWLRDAERKEAQARLAVAFRPNDGKWTLLDVKHASVRLTRSTVSFESKQLAARFCFLDAPIPRLPRAILGLGYMESLNTGRPGRLDLFTAFDRRRWALCVLCCPLADAKNAAASNESATIYGDEEVTVLQQQRQKWRPLLPLQPPGAQVERAIRAGRHNAASVAAAAAAAEQAKDKQLLLREGDVFQLQLTGDFRLRQPTNSAAAADSKTSEFMLLQYHPRFANDPIVFDIVPTDRTTTIASDFFSYLLELAEDEGDMRETTEEKLVDKAGNETLTFRGSIKVTNSAGETVSNHEFSVGFFALKQYLDLKPPPPPPPPTAVEGDDATGDATGAAGKAEDTQQIAWSHHYPRILKLRIYELDPEQARLESRQRLLAPRRNAQPSHLREPRALSRRSLQTLASQLPQQGVTLAAELGLADSAVSALGFETLSNRSDTTSAGNGGFTFRVLLYWKRACATPEQGSLTDQLADALARIGRRDLSAALRECVSGNRELLPERFQSSEQQQQQPQQQRQHLLLLQQ